MLRRTKTQKVLLHRQLFPGQQHFFSFRTHFFTYLQHLSLLDDVVVENQQAIEMTRIYRDIIQGTRELLSSLMDNRLNSAMKYLASITIVMAIPTIISGIYGMNVSEKWMPLAHTPYGFGIICVLILVACVITMKVLKKRKML